VIHWGIQQAQRVGPLAAPGAYTVRLTAAGQTLSRPFEVVKDPTITSSDHDLWMSTRTQIRIRDDLNETVDMINRLEIMRKQIEDLLKTHKGRPALERALRDLDKKMMDVELMLLSRTEMHSDDKWYVEAYKVYLNLIWLNGAVGTGAGDEAGGADYRPTDAQLAVLETIEQDLAKARVAFKTLMEKDVPAFNKAMAGKLPAITDTLAAR